MPEWLTNPDTNINDLDPLLANSSDRALLQSGINNSLVSLPIRAVSRVVSQPVIVNLLMENVDPAVLRYKILTAGK